MRMSMRYRRGFSSSMTDSPQVQDVACASFAFSGLVYWGYGFMKAQQIGREDANDQIQASCRGCKLKDYKSLIIVHQLDGTVKLPAGTEAAEGSRATAKASRVRP